MSKLSTCTIIESGDHRRVGWVRRRDGCIDDPNDEQDKQDQTKTDQGCPEPGAPLPFGILCPFLLLFRKEAFNRGVAKAVDVGKACLEIPKLPNQCQYVWEVIVAVKHSFWGSLYYAPAIDFQYCWPGLQELRVPSQNQLLDLLPSPLVGRCCWRRQAKPLERRSSCSGDSGKSPADLELSREVEDPGWFQLSPSCFGVLGRWIETRRRSFSGCFASDLWVYCGD